MFQVYSRVQNSVTHIHIYTCKIHTYIHTYLCFIDYAKAFDCVDHNKLWKILKEMEIPDHLTCLLRNLYAGQEATVRTGRGTTDWFQIGKGVCQGCILTPCLFNFYAEYIMRNAGLEEAQAGGPVAKMPHFQSRGLALIPGQGTRSHMPQLRVCIAFCML